MKFEELQAIWDTQNERPVFSLNDSRLAVGLYQQRQESRRRLFRGYFAPTYVAALSVAVFSAFLFLAFFMKTITRMRTTDPLMSVWDGAALVVAIMASLAWVVPIYVERRKHERAQEIFAPSLREELELGIAQLDFEVSLHSKTRARKMIAFVSIGVTVVLWETARLNGQPAPWMMMVFSSFSLFTTSWYGAASKKQIDPMMQRKRALESMRAALAPENEELQ